MNPVSDPLASLRDIHLPPEPSWWPPAPAWWLLALAVMLLVAWLGRRCRRRYRRWRLRRDVMARLSGLRHRCAAGGAAGELAGELSILLRQAALARFPRAEVAGLTGRGWLEFLDRSGATDQFTRGVGAALLTAPYQARPALAFDPLADLAEGWLKRNV